MTAETAAAYVDERSVQAFRRSVGRLWPKPLKVAGKGERWTKEMLDEAIDGLSHDPNDVRKRGRRVVKPLGWPRYMIAKRLKSGQVAYYWSPRNADIAKGFTLSSRGAWNRLRHGARAR